MPWVAEARPHALRLWSPRDADVSEASMRRKDVPLADSDVTVGLPHSRCRSRPREPAVPGLGRLPGPQCSPPQSLYSRGAGQPSAVCWWDCSVLVCSWTPLPVAETRGRSAVTCLEGCSFNPLTSSFPSCWPSACSDKPQNPVGNIFQKCAGILISIASTCGPLWGGNDTFLVLAL